MKKIGLLLINHYKNSRIKVKLFITISLSMVVTLLCLLIGLTYAFSLYDEQLYAKSSQVLIMSSNSIEEKLERIEEVSYLIATNPQIQKKLLELEGKLTKYDYYRIEREIVDVLANYVGSEKNIHSITLLGFDRIKYVAGSTSNPLSESDISRIQLEASKFEGGNLWIENADTNHFLTSARQIRSYQNLSFDNIGSLLISVDLDKIVSALPKLENQASGTFAISKDNNVFYSEDAPTRFNGINYLPKTKKGYSIEEVNEEKFFISHIYSSFDSWVYWSVIPYDVMFAKVTAIKYFIVFLFVLMFVILIFVSINFSRRITNPIEQLVIAMQHVQVGNFKVVDQMNTSLINEDEVGVLYKRFKIMVERIDELINENYTKQLLLKETEYKALQAQINPHFLYNTLESINWQAKVNQQLSISSMVESLGYILRHSINFRENMISFKDDLEILKHYITIQKYRFEERLVVHIDISPDLLECNIPKLTMQPIVENAIQHALEPSLDTCLINIKAYKDGGNVYLRIEDNGPGVDLLFLEQVKNGEAVTKGNGIGLKNIEERIKLSFGEPYGLKIENIPTKGTAVTVILPF